jgi:hypothetical protein
MLVGLPVSVKSKNGLFVDCFKIEAPKDGAGLERENSQVKTTVSKAKFKSTTVFSAEFTHKCGSCDESVKSVKREFSDQAWAALVSWREVSPKSVDSPLCNDCYFNFRDVLIERADEIRLMSGNIAANAKATPMHGVTSKVARA